jgi:hypothetical protein
LRQILLAPLHCVRRDQWRPTTPQSPLSRDEDRIMRLGAEMQRRPGDFVFIVTFAREILRVVGEL